MKIDIITVISSNKIDIFNTKTEKKNGFYLAGEHYEHFLTAATKKIFATTPLKFYSC